VGKGVPEFLLPIITNPTLRNRLENLYITRVLSQTKLLLLIEGSLGFNSMILMAVIINENS
jgi:hypothetical protein